MGVYIKDIEMPKGCAFCKFKKRNGKKMICPFLNEEWDIHDPMSADFKLENCPLIQVPPHGRLIDADAKIEIWDVCGRRGIFPQYTTTVSKFLLGHLVGKIPPTIIPAEENE